MSRLKQTKDLQTFDNQNYLTKSKAKGLLDISFVMTQKSVTLSPPNIIVPSTGTTSETIFISLHYSQKTSKRLSDWQILKVLFDYRGTDLHDLPYYYFVH